MGDRVTILGSRGSVPVSGAEYVHFGGSTTCVLVELDDTCIILDAGTGIRNIPESVLQRSELPLFLTHAHLDHLIGLPMFPYLFRKNAHLSVYADGPEQMARLFSPPYWPLSLQELPAEVSFHPMPDQVRIQTVCVERMRGSHPGGVSVFRLSGRRHTVVFATDCTLTDEVRPTLLQFADGCDLLIIDGQYSDEEWADRKAYGHSRWTEAARLGLEAGALQIRITHHDPAHTDAFLVSAEASLRPDCLFAREGEMICL